MRTLVVYALAAVTEIGGCFSFWAWLRNGKTWRPTCRRSIHCAAEASRLDARVILGFPA